MSTAVSHGRPLKTLNTKIAAGEAQLQKVIDRLNLVTADTPPGDAQPPDDSRLVCFCFFPKLCVV